MQKPTSMPHADYTTLSPSEKRQLPDTCGRDGFINKWGYPKLTLRFHQVKFKTPKHGTDHGLEVGNNGKTPNTETHAIALRDSLLEMPNSPNIIWYTDGEYQGGTPNGYGCVK